MSGRVNCFGGAAENDATVADGLTQPGAEESSVKTASALQLLPEKGKEEKLDCCKQENREGDGQESVRFSGMGCSHLR